MYKLRGFACRAQAQSTNSPVVSIGSSLELGSSLAQSLPRVNPRLVAKGRAMESGARGGTGRSTSAPDATDFALELILSRPHPGCVVPFGDLDRTVAEQLRDAVQRDPF
jgi:hypothetical protein